MNNLKFFGISLGVCYVIIISLFLITSAIFAHTNINDKYIDIFVYVSIFISMLTSSLLFSKKVKEKGIIYGAMFGIIAMFVFYLVVVMIMPEASFTLNILIFFILATIASSIGGIIGVNL